MNSIKKLNFFLGLFLTCAGVLSIAVIVMPLLQNIGSRQQFTDGNAMMSLLDRQLRFGPRFLGATGHEEVKKFLIAEMDALAGKTKIQTWQHTGPDGQKYELTNIIGRFYPANKKRIILAAHYDSKKFADKDIDQPDQPVPGANDSASGVAVLLELAKVLKNTQVKPNIGIDLVFFDGEEGVGEGVGDFANWKPLGSTYFIEHLNEIYGDNKPIGGVVLDMICQKDLRIFKEQSSMQNAPAQTEIFWNIGKKVDSNVFFDKVGPEIRDDHTSLNQAGIPSFLVIDFEYSPWHTTHDTIDKCSAKSLEIVAGAVLNYVYSAR